MFSVVNQYGVRLIARPTLRKARATVRKYADPKAPLRIYDEERKVFVAPPRVRSIRA